MAQKPLIFHTTHRVQFSELDPYNHVGTGMYAAYFIDHRMQGLRDHVGWDLAALGRLPFMVWTRRLEIDFIRPALADQEIAITSFVREFKGPDAVIECSMLDSTGKTLARAVMTIAYVDKETGRSKDWPVDTIALFYQ